MSSPVISSFQSFWQGKEICGFSVCKNHLDERVGLTWDKDNLHQHSESLNDKECITKLFSLFTSTQKKQLQELELEAITLTKAIGPIIGSFLSQCIGLQKLELTKIDCPDKKDGFHDLKAGLVTGLSVNSTIHEINFYQIEGLPAEMAAEAFKKGHKYTKISFDGSTFLPSSRLSAIGTALENVKEIGKLSFYDCCIKTKDLEGLLPKSGVFIRSLDLVSNEFDELTGLIETVRNCSVKELKLCRNKNLSPVASEQFLTDVGKWEKLPRLIMEGMDLTEKGKALLANIPLRRKAYREAQAQKPERRLARAEKKLVEAKREHNKLEKKIEDLKRTIEEAKAELEEEQPLVDLTGL